MLSAQSAARVGREPVRGSYTSAETRSKEPIAQGSFSGDRPQPIEARRTSRLRLLAAQTSAPLPATPEESRQVNLTPLAFLPPPPEAGLNEDQTASLAQIGNDFVQAVGGPGQDPADPAYLNKWESALFLADQQVWAVAGQNAYAALMNQRAQAAGNSPAGQ